MMRRFFLLSILGLLLQPAAAQKDHKHILQEVPGYSVAVNSERYGSEVQPAFTIRLVSDAGRFEKFYLKEFRTRYKLKLKRNSGLLEARKALITEWLSDSVNFAFRVEKDGELARLILFVQTSCGFVGPGCEPDDAVERITLHVEKSVRQYYQGYYTELIAEQQREFNRQQHELGKLESAGVRNDRSRSALLKSIQSSQDDLKRLENDLKSNESNRIKLQQTLEQQKREQDALKRELDNVNVKVLARQKDYDNFNRKGELNTKQAQKTEKELTKLKQEQEKAQIKVADKGKTVAAAENKLLENDRKKTAIESSIRDTEISISRQQSEVESLQRAGEENSHDREKKKAQVDEALELLNALKAARAALSAIQ